MKHARIAITEWPITARRASDWEYLRSPAKGWTVPLAHAEAGRWITKGKGRMVKAIWNGVVIATSDATVVVDGNHYFPRKDVDAQYLAASSTHTTCGWKGVASYYSLSVAGATNPDAAWFYPEPKAAAAEITDRIAFWKGVEVR